MANNIQLNSGTGGSVLATEQNGAAEQYQKIKLVDGTAGAFTNMAAVSAASALKVDASGAPIQANAGTNLNTSLLALESGGNLATLLGRFPATAALTDAVANPTLSQIASFLHGYNGTTWDRLRATTANGLAVDVTRVQGSVAVTGTFWQATQPVSIAGNQAVNVAQINGVAPLMGNGVTGTGSQRVTIASDNTAFTVNAAQSGTWTVQPGNTANTTPWLTSDRPATSGGASIFYLNAAATTNATNVKASAGQVYGVLVTNTNAAQRYLCFHNTAGTPTAGASVLFKVGIPGASAGAGNNFWIPCGAAFGTGIGISTVTGAADNNATAVGVNDLLITIFYS